MESMGNGQGDIIYLMVRRRIGKMPFGGLPWSPTGAHAPKYGCISRIFSKIERSL